MSPNEINASHTFMGGLPKCFQINISFQIQYIFVEGKQIRHANTTRNTYCDTRSNFKAIKHMQSYTICTDDTVIQ